MGTDTPPAKRRKTTACAETLPVVKETSWEVPTSCLHKDLIKTILTFLVEGLRVSGFPEVKMNGFYEKVDLQSSIYPEAKSLKNLTKGLRGPGTTVYYRHESGKHVIVRSIYQRHKYGDRPIWSFRNTALTCLASYDPTNPSGITTWTSTPLVWPSRCRGTLYSKNLSRFSPKSLRMKLSIQ